MYFSFVFCIVIFLCVCKTGKVVARVNCNREIHIVNVKSKKQGKSKLCWFQSHLIKSIDSHCSYLFYIIIFDWQATWLKSQNKGIYRNRGERIVFSGPNTNTNTIWLQKCGRIRIRILFGFRNMAEYEYEYYSGSEIWPNTNTNIIRSAIYVRIRIRIFRLFE